MDNPVIRVEKVSKSFEVGGNVMPILKNISLAVAPGDFAIIFGPSGCGKSTLLHTILGLEEPTSGSIFFLESNVYVQKNRNSGVIPEDDRSEIRKKHVGMVYQQANWIKALTVLENVAFPLQLLGIAKKEALGKASEMLALLGMSEWAAYIPTELSSGQQQKVALARALVTNPEVIIADEPTGNLDYESGQDLMKILTKFNITLHKTILMVTHDLEYLTFAKTAIRMFNGEIVGTYSGERKTGLLKELKSKRGKKK